MRARPYEILCRGPVPTALFSDVLADFPSIAVQTVLTGQVRDQAELHGLLRRLHDLGIELVAFRQLIPAPPADGAEPAVSTAGRAVPPARDGA
ncbi:MAG: hypothetical protein WCF04_11915 [Candidatus Nanopelagicales bacterium]